MGGKAVALLCSHGTWVCAAPPCRQDKNGLVERQWLSLTKMVCSFWQKQICLRNFCFGQFVKWISVSIFFQSLRKRVLLILLVIKFSFHLVALALFVEPVISITTALILSHNLCWVLLLVEVNTPMVWFFITKLWIAFCASADYLIDKNQYVSEVFPSLRYDRGLTMSVLSGKDVIPTKFSIEDCVFIQDNKMYDILEGTVTMPPTTQIKHYTITLIDDSTVHFVAPSNFFDENDVPSAGKPSASMGSF